MDELTKYNKELGASPLAVYKWLFEKEKELYITLNMFHADNNWFRGLCWCPINKKEEVERELNILRNTKKVECSNLDMVKDHELKPDRKSVV